MILVGCSSLWCPTLAIRRRRRGRGRWLPPYPKESLEKIPGSWRGSGESAGRSSTGSPAHFALRIGFRFDIRRGVRACHLGGSSLRIGGIFFVLASEISAFLIKRYRFDQLKWIGVMRRREPGHLHVEFAFIQ